MDPRDPAAPEYSAGKKVDNILDETKDNYGSARPDSDIGRNMSEETRGSKVGERLDEEPGTLLEHKANLQQKVGEEAEEDMHDLAARKQP